MSGNHTKGPWIADGDRVWLGSSLLATAWLPRTVSDEREDGESWLDMRNRTQPERDAVVAETKANARLMAAAPVLLEALTKAVNETEHCLFEAWLVRVGPSGDFEAVQRQWLESSDYREFTDEWREQIAAIAKATGTP